MSQEQPSSDSAEPSAEGKQAVATGSKTGRRPAKTPLNPFYGLVLISGVAFTLSACMSGWMLYLDSRRFDADMPTVEDSPMLSFVRHRAWELFGTELGLLAVGTAGSLLWDRYWMLRRKREAEG